MVERVLDEPVVATDGDSISVLHVDDDRAFLDLTRRWLSAERDDISVTSTTDTDEALSLLGLDGATDGGTTDEAVDGDGDAATPDAGTGPTDGPGAEPADPQADGVPPFDCVVSDYDMPGLDGLEFLERVREASPDLPFVLFTGKGSEEIASEAISAGVTDYLQKETGSDQFTVLANRVENAVAQRRAEREAERSAQRIQQVFERITDAFVAIDREWRYTYVNDRAAELLETDPDDLLGQHVLEAFPELEGTAFEDAFERAMRDQEPVTVDEHFEPLDTWSEVRVFPARDGLSIYFRDITERKRREEALREERAFTESIFAGLPDALYTFDETGTFLRWNDEFAAATGYSDAEIAEMHPLEFVPDDEESKTAANVAAVVENGEQVTVESYLETKAGERVPYEFTGAPLVDRDGTELGLVGIGRDITDRREREREFAAVFNNTYQFTGLLEPDGTLIRANDTALEFGGVDREAVIGSHLAETVWVMEENRERVGEAVERAAEGEFVRFEMEIEGAGEPAVIDFSVKPVTDEDGEVVLLIPEGRDITERNRREQELARKNERLEAFTSVVSHDLKNPLSVASGCLELYRESAEPDPELIERAADALDRMEWLIDDLLDLAEKGRVVDEPVAVALSPVLDRAIGLVDTDGVEVAVSGDEATVLADRDRLAQLVENLLSNATEHADERVRVEVDDGGRRLAVADDGPGIPPEEREAVFQPGYSDTDEGHGFGLAIARDIAEAHGWSLDAEDSELGGARFVVEGLEPAE